MDSEITQHHALLQSAQQVLQVNLPQVLADLLEQSHRTRLEFYDYLLANGYEIDQAAMYRYFNPNNRVMRLPTGTRGIRFLSLFCKFLALPGTQCDALVFLWQVHRQQRRKNGARRIG